MKTTHGHQANDWIKSKPLPAYGMLISNKTDVSLIPHVIIDNTHVMKCNRSSWLSIGTFTVSILMITIDAVVTNDATQFFVLTKKEFMIVHNIKYSKPKCIHH